MFKEIVPVCAEKHMKSYKMKKLLVVKAGGTYSYRWALKFN
jgi:hypothetical protein